MKGDGSGDFFGIVALGGLILFCAYHLYQWVSSWGPSGPPEWFWWLIGIALVLALVGFVAVCSGKDWGMWVMLTGFIILAPFLPSAFQLLRALPFIFGYN